MLITSSKLIGTPVLSVQTSSAIATVTAAIIDPDNLKVIGLRVNGPAPILDTKSIREYSNLGIVVDTVDELVGPDDIIKIQEVLALNFNLAGLKVETKKGSKLGHINDYTLTTDDFSIQQIIVKRPLVKSFIDPELTIHRREIIEVRDDKVIVRDEEKVLKSRASKEDFVPNFVNPFRTHEPGFAPADLEDRKHD